VSELPEDSNGNGIPDNLEERRMSNQRRMSWGAFASVHLVTALVLWGVISGFLPLESLAGLALVLGFYYTGMFGIIAAYFGVSGWIQRGQ